MKFMIVCVFALMATDTMAASLGRTKRGIYGESYNGWQAPQIRTIHVPVHHEHVKHVHVPFPVPQPYPVYKETVRHVPVDRIIVKKVIEHVPQPYPVIKEVVKHVPVEKVIIKKIAEPYPVVKEVPVVKHIPVEKIVHVPQPYPVEKVVVKEVVKHVPVPVHHEEHHEQPQELTVLVEDQHQQGYAGNGVADNGWNAPSSSGYDASAGWAEPQSNGWSK